MLVPACARGLFPWEWEWLLGLPPVCLCLSRFVLATWWLKRNTIGPRVLCCALHSSITSRGSLNTALIHAINASELQRWVLLRVKAAFRQRPQRSQSTSYTLASSGNNRHASKQSEIKITSITKSFRNKSGFLNCNDDEMWKMWNFACSLYLYYEGSRLWGTSWVKVVIIRHKPDISL